MSSFSEIFFFSNDYFSDNMMHTPCLSPSREARQQYLAKHVDSEEGHVLGEVRNIFVSGKCFLGMSLHLKLGEDSLLI